MMNQYLSLVVLFFAHDLVFTAPSPSHRVPTVLPFPLNRSADGEMICGTDSGFSTELFNRIKRSLIGDLGRLEGKVIRYRISRYPRSDLHKTVDGRTMRNYVDKALRNAVQLWERVIDVSFIEWPWRNADIEVRFASHYHGDEYPFDGPGNEVAHAFYPTHLRRHGQIHIDDNEPWGPGGRNLNWVLAHEVGHTLGLPHTYKDSIMMPHYKGFEEVEPRLYPEDVRNIQLLYGKKEGFDVTSFSEESPASSPLEPQTPALCDGNPFNTIFALPNGTIYIFKGESFWRLVRGKEKKIDGPFIISEFWGMVETPVDAAFTDKLDWTWIIKDDNAWRVDASSNTLKFFSKENMHNTPPFSNYLYNSVDAVLSFNDVDEGPTFFFLGPKYWFDGDSDGETDEGYYRQIKEIDSNLKLVDGAISLPDGEFLFSGNMYWKVHLERNSLKADRSYPRSIPKDWYGCN